LGRGVAGTSFCPLGSLSMVPSFAALGTLGWLIFVPHTPVFYCVSPYRFLGIYTLVILGSVAYAYGSRGGFTQFSLYQRDTVVMWMNSNETHVFLVDGRRNITIYNVLIPLPGRRHRIFLSEVRSILGSTILYGFLSAHTKTFKVMLPL
jgi:hypothetical protein